MAAAAACLGTICIMNIKLLNMLGVQANTPACYGIRTRKHLRSMNNCSGSCAIAMSTAWTQPIIVNEIARAAALCMRGGLVRSHGTLRAKDSPSFGWALVAHHSRNGWIIGAVWLRKDWVTTGARQC